MALRRIWKNWGQPKVPESSPPEGVTVPTPIPVPEGYSQFDRRAEVNYADVWGDESTLLADTDIVFRTASSTYTLSGKQGDEKMHVVRTKPDSSPEFRQEFDAQFIKIANGENTQFILTRQERGKEVADRKTTGEVQHSSIYIKTNADSVL